MGEKERGRGGQGGQREEETTCLLSFLIPHCLFTLYWMHLPTCTAYGILKLSTWGFKEDDFTC